MIPTIAVIPTRYEPERLAGLLEIVRPDCEQVIVLDNGHEPPLEGALDTRGMGIYQQWNLGWRMALERPPVNVAILNDDIRILPGTLKLMARALRAQPKIGVVYPNRHVPLAAGLPRGIDYMTLSDPIDSRDMTGFCFMFKGELPLPPFDEGYTWWYGDTEFDEAVKLAGYGVARINGLPIEHHSDAEANGWARRPELRDAAIRDGERWAKLHARIEGGRWVPE